MKTSELLTQAKSLIVDPIKWTQGEYAKTIDGIVVEPESSEAICFCSLGALHKIISKNIPLKYPKDTGPYEEAYNYLNKAIMIIEEKEPIDCLPVAGYNDSNGHAEVMKVWDTAIELAIKAGD